MIFFDQVSTTGSIPGTINWEDGKKLITNLALVGAAAAITFVLQSVIPQLHTDNPYLLAAIPLLTAGLQALLKLVTDSRTADEKRRLPVMEVRRQVEALQQRPE